MLFLAGSVSAQTKVLDNSGFVPGNLWFSRTPSTVGETVTIYTLVWNGSTEDVSGSVSFFDNDTEFGKQIFVLAGTGSSKILSVPWVVKEGYHKIYAEITESSAAPRGQSVSVVSLQYGKTQEAEQFVGAPKAAQSESPTTTVSNFVGEKVNFAKEYASENLPAPIVDTTKTAKNALEKGRILGESWSKQAVAELQKDLQISTTSANKGKTSGSGGGFNIERPLKYVEIFLLSILAFVSGNPWLFYAALILVVFFILRFIKRKFFF